MLLEDIPAIHPHLLRSGTARQTRTLHLTRTTLLRLQPHHNTTLLLHPGYLHPHLSPCLVGVTPPVMIPPQLPTYNH